MTSVPGARDLAEACSCATVLERSGAAGAIEAAAPPKAEGPTTATVPTAAAPKEASRRKRRREIPDIYCSFFGKATDKEASADRLVQLGPTVGPRKPEPSKLEVPTSKAANG